MILPYRTDGEDLERFLDAAARGRSFDQIQTLNFSRKGFEGTVTAAECLGLASREVGDLTDLGREFALADQGGRRALLLRAIREFDAYGLLLEAITARGKDVTETDWIEAWWSTHDYGGSSSNRSEGSTAFARLIEYTGVGTFLQGRRGHPSRIEWAENGLREGRDTTSQGEAASEHVASPSPLHATTAGIAEPGPGTNHEPADETVALTLPLGDGRTVHLRLPREMTEKEKERVMQLLDHLIAPS